MSHRLAARRTPPLALATLLLAATAAAQSGFEGLMLGPEGQFPDGRGETEPAASPDAADRLRDWPDALDGWPSKAGDDELLPDDPFGAGVEFGGPPADGPTLRRPETDRDLSFPGPQVRRRPAVDLVPPPRRNSLETPLLVEPLGPRPDDRPAFEGDTYEPPPLAAPELPDPSDTDAANALPPLRPVPRKTFRPESAPAGTPEGVRLSVDGRLLKTLFRNEQERDGLVNDRVLGADVTGTQTTRTRTRLELRPCSEAAQFEVVLEGRTLNQTTATAQAAAIASRGDHRFEMTKPFRFDGDRVRTATPSAVVWPRQTNLAAVPLRGRVPIVGRVIGRIAYGEAERRRPAAERIAADRVTRAAATAFNANVDAALNRLQTVWDEKLLETLERSLPEASRPTASTTATHLTLKLPTPNADPAEPPAEWDARGDGFTLAVHASAVEAAVDLLGLEGRDVPRGDWDGLVGRLMPTARLARRPVSDDGSATSLGTLRLADRDPVSVSFEGGRAEVTLRASVVSPLGTSPVQRIIIPWVVTADADAIYVEPRQPSVEADRPGEGDSFGEASAPGLMDKVREIVEMKVAEEMRPFRLRRSVTAPVSDRTMTARVADVKVRDGWLVVSWDASVE